jgi:hypothetical protein
LQAWQAGQEGINKIGFTGAERFQGNKIEGFEIPNDSFRQVHLRVSKHKNQKVEKEARTAT